MTESLPRPDTHRFPDLRDSDVRFVPAGTRLGRIYPGGGSHPSTWNTFRAWGPTRARFDHQPPPPREHPTRRVMYAAAYLPGMDGSQSYPLLPACLAEVFRDSGLVDTVAQSPCFTLFDVTRDLRLLDLADSDWVTRAGGNGAISSGSRGKSRAWARAIYRHYGSLSPLKAHQRVDGVIYPSSNIPPARSVALWETAADALPTRPALNDPLTVRGLRPALEDACRRIGLGLV